MSINEFWDKINSEINTDIVDYGDDVYGIPLTGNVSNIVAQMGVESHIDENNIVVDLGV